MAATRALTGLPWRVALPAANDLRYYGLQVDYQTAFKWFWRVRSWDVSAIGLTAECAFDPDFISNEDHLPCYRKQMAFTGSQDNGAGNSFSVSLRICAPITRPTIDEDYLPAVIQIEGPIYLPFIHVEISGVFEGDIGFRMNSFVPIVGETDYGTDDLLNYTIGGVGGDGALYTVPDSGITPSFAVTPASYWQYAYDDGGDPWWDASTGEPIGGNPLLVAI